MRKVAGYCRALFIPMLLSSIFSSGVWGETSWQDRLWIGVIIAWLVIIVSTYQKKAEDLFHRASLIIWFFAGFFIFEWATRGTAGHLLDEAAVTALFEDPLSVFSDKLSHQYDSLQATLVVEKVSLSGKRAVIRVHAHNFSKRQSYRSPYYGVVNHNCGLGVVDKDNTRFTSQGIVCQPQSSHRDHIRNQICDILLCTKSASGAWAYASLFGHRQMMDPNRQSVLRYFGLVHLSSVSGFHLSLMVILIRIFFLFLGFWPQVLRLFIGEICRKGHDQAWLRWMDERRFIMMIGAGICEVMILGAWLYVIGFLPSALRAFLCYLIVRVARAVHHRLSFMDLMTLSLLGFFMISPLDVWSLSSRLSWIAYGIIMITFFLFLDSQRSVLQQTHSSLSWSSSKVVEGVMKGISALASICRRVVPIMKMWLMSQLGLQWMGFLMIGEMSWLGLVGNLLALPILSLHLKFIVLVGFFVWGVHIITATDRLIWMFERWLQWTDQTFNLLEQVSQWVLTKAPVMVFRNDLPGWLIESVELGSLMALFMACFWISQRSTAHQSSL